MSTTKRSKPEILEPSHSLRRQPLSEAELISRALKDVAREARRPATAWLGIFRDFQGRPMKPFAIGMVLSFFFVVLVPLALSSVYLAFFAANQYASEVRFAVRGGDNTPLDAISALTGSTSAMKLQDSAIVAEYIRGRGIVEYLEKSVKLREKFSYSTGKADYLFGFNTSRSMERLTRYWWWQVDVSIDRMSGIVTVVVRAFTPQDALELARSIIFASEALANELTERARRDALKQAQRELALAERILQDKIQQMREVRDKERILDPTQTSDALTKMLGELRLEIIRMESEFAAQRRQLVSENAPQLRVLTARIEAAKEQAKSVESKLTSTSSKQQPALAESMSAFDRVRLEQEFAQKQYVAAASALEKARLEVESKQLYLTTFLYPVLAEEAEYPKRLWILSAMAIVLLLLWGLGAGLAFLIRNYAA